jgi:hypothetical protein
MDSQTIMLKIPIMDILYTLLYMEIIAMKEELALLVQQSILI